jgi:hypothetical protein
MQAMGVDVIIAVDVEFPLYGPDELDSALTISEQMLTILIRKETLRQIERSAHLRRQILMTSRTPLNRARQPRARRR